jgi:serine/threonine-protein kinase
LAQACEGLHAIHEAVDSEGRPLSIVHRDVSPQNLLVAYDGSIRLLDFGIASAEGRAHTGSADVVRGRYAYMAPEQMRGLDLDRRADVWSLGVMLREAVTGHNPYLRDTQIATMLAVTQEPAPNWPVGSEPRLRAIAELAAAREPKERFASARELGNALTRYLSERSETALSTELSEHMRKAFAQEIADKRATLRALAQDDTHADTYSSGYPAVQVSALPATNNTARPAQRARTSKPKRWPRRTLYIGVCSLFALSLGLGWFYSRAERRASTFATRTHLAARPQEPGAAASPTGRTSEAPAPGTTSANTEAAPLPVLLDQAAEGAPDTSTPIARATAVEVAQPAQRPRAAQPSAHKPEISDEMQGSGTLVIGTSQGWATIYEKGKKLGNSPLRIELSAGDHALVIRPYGEGAARHINVDVRPGETVKLRVEL